jgi:Na+-transporting NADH:ubiquinone oxidoreductase subunit B
VFLKQAMMRRVLYALAPIGLWSIWLYGWRVLALSTLVFLLGILTELVFEQTRNKKPSEAVLVTCALFALSLPPGLPLWVAAVGIVFAVVFGKEVYGGFGRNVFNPAVTGRTFTYISFPLMMQTTWMLPGAFGMGGVNGTVQHSVWLEAVFMIGLAVALFVVLPRQQGRNRAMVITVVSAVLLVIGFYVATAYLGIRSRSAPWNEVDAVTMATPIEVFKGLAQQNNWQPAPAYGYLVNNDPWAMFFGLRVGSIGEGAIFLILIAAVYLVWTKTANWRPMVWTVGSALVLTAVFYYTGAMAGRFPLLAVKDDLRGQLNDILRFMMSGALLFGAVFMVTDPVSAPKKRFAQALYGLIIGGITIVIRVFAGFPEGISFAILTANIFASLLDEISPTPQKKTATVKTGSEIAEGAQA